MHMEPGIVDGTKIVLSYATASACALYAAKVLCFAQRCGEASRWVTSVCTGALLLGGAGLLRGYRAASHWYVRDLLPLLDALPVNQRVVRDRNRVTGAGVTAGMDLALTLSALLRGEGHARRQQLVSQGAGRCRPRHR